MVSRSDRTLQFSTSVEVRLGIVGPSVRWSVGVLFFWKTAHRIFPIFCMNVPYYMDKKRARPFFREKSGSFKNHENGFLNDLIKYRPFS